MTEKAFNLLEEPWIRAMLPNCTIQICSMGKRPAAGIIAHAVFANPNDRHATVSDQFHAAMRDACARTKEQNADCGRRNMYTAAFLGNQNRAVLSTERALLQVEKGHPIPHLRKRLQIRAYHSGNLCRHCLRSNVHHG